MIEPVAPSPHRNAASSNGRARGLAALVGLAVAAFLMLAGPATTRPAEVGPTCAGAILMVMSRASDPGDAGIRAAGIEATVDAAAAEFGLPRAAQDTTRSHWPDRVAYADRPDIAPTPVADGSPHRPPRAG